MAVPASLPAFRVGNGYDIHRFGAGRPLVLGGVLFPDETGLAGHSDADVVLHALIDALLGAAALGDIGERFPPGDARFAGADSAALTGIVVAEMRRAEWEVAGIDITVICERPRLRPRVAEMRARIAALLDVAIEQVSVKGKTNEGLDAIGRGEAIAAWATALVTRNGSVATA